MRKNKYKHMLSLHPIFNIFDNKLQSLLNQATEIWISIDVNSRKVYFSSDAGWLDYTFNITIEELKKILLEYLMLGLTISYACI